MTNVDILNWVRNQWAPITPATPDGVILQLIDNAIRFFNSETGFPFQGMVSITGPTTVPAIRGAGTGPSTMLRVPPQCKQVVEVKPSSGIQTIFQAHPMYQLLGMVLLDNVTTDLIMLQEAFKGYQVYTGTDFKWQFVMSDDPTVGGQLFLLNTPPGIDSVFVRGTRRILPGEDITSEYILNWILRYTHALTKISEGRLLRQGNMIGLKTDGDDLVKEGTEEKKELEDEAIQGNRWIALARRG